MATQLPFEKAIIRIQDNDARFNTFVNGSEAEFYKTTNGVEVTSIQNFLKTKSSEIDSAIHVLVETIVGETIVNNGGVIGGGGTVIVDDTPPPTPTWLGLPWSGDNLENPPVTSGFSYVYIKCDQPAYSEGRGHLKTIVYGATGNGTVVFEDAKPVGEFTGDFFSLPSSPGVYWHFWLKWVTVDNVQSAIPGGGWYGVTATTQKIGNVDLGALIIEAANLADGTITASKLAEKAIDATKFANDIEPITVITTLTLPTIKSTTMVFFQGKLYKWNGVSYSSDIAATDLSGTIKPAQLNNAVVQLEDGTVVVLADAVANSQVPAINFIGDFLSHPEIGTLKQNSVYKNTTDDCSYILSGTPLSWGLYLESGLSWDIKIESSNGTIFRVGQFSHTMLIAHVFRNGVDVTEMIQDSRFRWRRVSYTQQPPPFDDTTWNLSYSAGYKQIQVSVDEVMARATFHCDIFDS